MARKKKIVSGRIVSFYLGESHILALERYQRRRAMKSQAEALRAVLEVVGLVEDSHEAQHGGYQQVSSRP